MKRRKILLVHSSGLYFPFLMILLILSCKESNGLQFDQRINTAHLDHLYEEIVMPAGGPAGIVHIYCEYPDYQWVGDDDEGIACVDDASRAAIFYLRHYTLTGDQNSLHKAHMLLKFLLAMQAQNGYFYNFIWPDFAIHTAGKTTRAEPNWWSWRTLWAYGEAQTHLPEEDTLKQEISASRDKLVSNILRDFSLSGAVDTFGGMEIPAWNGSALAADQAALIIMGLTALFQESPDPSIEIAIRTFAKSILAAQVNAEGAFPDGAFLSWQNLWHAYGNNQSYALLLAGRALGDEEMINAALAELDKFIPVLLERKMLHHFYVEKKGDHVTVLEETVYPQIAYDQRPVIWACLEASKVTGEARYLDMAVRAGQWFAGQNKAQVPMYDPGTGRGYDGIISHTEINRNAGAESTIEALLALQALSGIQ